jgi:integrase
MSESSPGQWTLEQYIRDVYIPSRVVAVNLRDGTARGYLRLAQKVNECFGREARLQELDAYAIEVFSRWLQAERGVPETTGRAHRYSLLTILRHWNPDRFPRKKDDMWTASRVFIELDETDGLEGVFVNRYLPQRPSIGSPKTIQQYGFIFCRLAEFLDRPSTIGDLTDETIGRFAIWRRDVGKVAAVTINGELQKIRAMWNWLAKKRLVECYPTIGNLPEPERLPKAWSRDQLAALMAAIRKQTYRIGGIPAAAWWTAFHMVAWDSGERSGALRLLTWEMLDFDRGCLSVPAPVRKGGRKAMVYHLKPPDARRARSDSLPRA